MGNVCRFVSTVRCEESWLEKEGFEVLLWSLCPHCCTEKIQVKNLLFGNYGHWTLLDSNIVIKLDCVSPAV